MAISFINATSATATNGGNATITYGTTLTSDCIIVAVTLGTSKASALAVTSSSGGAFTQIVATIASSYARFGVFRQIVSSASLITQAIITGTGGTSDATTGVAHVFRGVSSASPEDTTCTSTTGASSLPDSPNITPATGSVNLPFAVVTSVGIQLVAAPTGPSGYNDAVTRNANDTNDATTGQAWEPVQSTAAVNVPVWTSSLTASWCSATTLLRPIIPTWRGENEYGTAAQVDEQRRIVMTSYGVV